MADEDTAVVVVDWKVDGRPPIGAPVKIGSRKVGRVRSIEPAGDGGWNVTFDEVDPEFLRSIKAGARFGLTIKGEVSGG